MTKGMATSAVCATVFAVILASGVCIADELRVDIAMNQTRSDMTNTLHWTEWKFPDSTSQTRTFGSVTVTIAKGTRGSGLKASWYKFAIDYGALLSLDAIYVDGVSSGYTGEINMTLSGLSTGHHSVAGFHNTTMSSTTSKVSVYVNNVLQVSNIAPTYRVTDDYDCASSYVEFDAVAGTPVVISYRCDTSGTIDSPVLNGFEIDRSNPAKRAKKPTPANDDEHYDCDSGSASLNWTGGSGAVSHDVYFGTDIAAVTAADRSSPLFRGNQTTTTHTVSGINTFDYYYWRIDEVASGGSTTKGDIWMFRARHPAFPGAEGYGRFARGGRGGTIVEVTNLLDYDTSLGEAVIPGSLRAVIESTGPRTIVFRVSGVIPLKKKLVVSKTAGHVTIAGQTAPGDGICITNFSFGGLGARDVIWRFIRTRVGDFCQTAMDGMGLASCHDSIMDHCSISWTIDEAHSSRSANNISFQRNIIAEPLNYSCHYDDANDQHLGTMPHGYGASISGKIGSYHHNLLAHCTHRTWSLAGGLTQGALYAGYLDIRNNVIYNWSVQTCDGGVKQLNFVSNYYKPGPSSTWFMLMGFDGDEMNHGASDRQMAYAVGNKMEGFPQYDADNWDGIEVKFHATEADVRVDTPFFGGQSYVTTQTADEAYAGVPDDAGATRPRRDRMDARVVREMRDGSYTYLGSKPHVYQDVNEGPLPGIIDSQDDVGGYASLIYRTYNVPMDSDHDGMPDWWETMKGLNPNSASGDFSDSNGDPDDDGYTNLEDYLNYLADGGSQLEYWECTASLLADLNGDCRVDFSDFAAFAGGWNTPRSISDINDDNTINLKDLMFFYIDWLACNRDPSSSCW